MILSLKKRKHVLRILQLESLPTIDSLNILIKAVICSKVLVIVFQHWYYNEAFLRNLAKNMSEKYLF